MKKFQYKKPRKKKPPVVSVRPAEEGAPQIEALTGYIKGIPANSMAEERLANAMNKNPAIEGYVYNFIAGTMNMPGWKQLDFLIQTVMGQTLAVSVKDTEFIHFGAEALAQDAVNEMYVIDELKKQHIYVDKIISIDAMDLDTQELADRSLKELVQ